MYGQDKGGNARNLAFAMNFLHVVLGIAIIVLALISFLNPEGNMVLFPIIFLAASILQGASGWYHINEGRRLHRRGGYGWLLLLVSLLLFVLAVVSAVSIWR